MRRRARAVAATLAAALLFHPAGVLAGDVQAPPTTIEGRYFVESDKASILIMPGARGAPNVYHVVAVQWEGVGFFDGTSYWGVFRGLAGATGTHRGLLGSDGSLTVHGEYTTGRTGSFETIWRPERIETPPDELPKSSDYVYVEELPEAVTKVPPVYPQGARDARIEGIVLVQALVGKDGFVKDTRVLKSVPRLDEAAEAAVRQWLFKPASTKRLPVAVWIAVPVRFTLH